MGSKENSWFSTISQKNSVYTIVRSLKSECLLYSAPKIAKTYTRIRKVKRVMKERKRDAFTGFQYQESGVRVGI